MEPDSELSERIFQQAETLGLPVRDGRHWSTDGFYRETAGLVERHRQAGALGVDMECTGLWAAARFRGIKLVALMVISDLLYDGQHHLGFDLPEFAEGLKQATKLAWRALGVSSSSGV
jgi:purine-nucleoside phosphorylase